MFWNKDSNQQKVRELTARIAEMKDQISKLKEELEDLKLKKKIEEEDIKHMVRIKQEKLEIEHEKAVNKAKSDAEQTIGEVKDQYRDKMELFLQKQVQDVKEMYGQILKRLPDVNVRLKGDV